jgi:hypothetical protein
MRRLHPVFPVVKLTPAPEETFPGRRQPTPPPPVIVDDVEEYEVEKVLNSRKYYRKVQYLVKWKGYGDADNEWVSADNFHAPEALRDFYALHPTAIRAVRSDCPWRVRFEDALEAGVIPTVFWKKKNLPSSMEPRTLKGG